MAPTTTKIASTTSSDYDLYINFYSKPNFDGKSVQLPLNFTDCKNIFEGEFAEWEGVPQSMKVSNGSCVEVYMEHFCSGSIHIELTMAAEVPDLSQVFGLGERIRSLQICNKILETTTTTDTEGKGDSQEAVITRWASTMWITIAGICAFVATALTLVLIRLKKRANSLNTTSSETLSEKEIDEFMKGLGLQMGFIFNEKEYGNDISKEENEEGSSELSAELLALNQPYKQQLEIPLNQLKFDDKFPIGSGEFGNVYKGTLMGNSEVCTTVAIKTTKSQSHLQYLRVLLKEVKVMMFVGKHPRIVDLIGCCTVNLRQGNLLIVLEYCEKGSLERYMKANRDNFDNIVHKGNIISHQKEKECLHHNSSFQLQNVDYVQAFPELGSTVTTKQVTVFNIHQLILWCIEIAEGMEYLAMKKVIHGDLSARNILLSSELNAKISDFGLSKKMYQYSHCSKNGTEPLPWRWLALESLKNLQFSTASDVWSYAILLWEIFTLGEQPYPGVSSLTNNFILNLEQGLRPTLPPFSTSDIYNIMSSCWDEDPKRRPSFTILMSRLQEVKDNFEIKTSLLVASGEYSTSGNTTFV
ncbi:unnamed protein product [Orchesella dallaii]|uniref:Protein kinase domain-containing protein n=1 Tax=Orchesella dallaii TaxID=48710 RepID=A0ABP1R0A4_9HEXA